MCIDFMHDSPPHADWRHQGIYVYMYMNMYSYIYMFINCCLFPVHHDVYMFISSYVYMCMYVYTYTYIYVYSCIYIFKISW